MNQQLVDRQSFSNWVMGSLTKVTCVTGFHLRDNIGIHILNSVSDHVQLVILIPHAIHVDDDVDEIIMDGHRGKNNAASYHLLTLVDDGGSGYRSNPGRALRDPRGPLSNSLRGWGGPIIEEALGPGDPLLPSAAGVRGGAYYRTGVGDIGWGSTRTEWCISCTCYFPSGSTYT